MNFGLYYPPFPLDKEKTGSAGPRWTEWINGFDLMLNNCGVSEREKYALFQRFVGRSVRDILTNLRADDKTIDEYPVAKRLLSEYFRKLSSSNKTYQRYLFAWLRQRAEESFVSFTARVEDLGKECDFRTDYDRRIRDQIVLGCRSDEIRRQAFLNDFDLKSLLEVGKELQDESDTGLLTSGGDVISVFLPDSAVSLFRVSISSSQNSSPSSSSQPQKLANHQKHSLPSSRTCANGSSTAAAAIDHLSHFDDLSLVNYPPDGAPALTKDEMKKEKAKERRRRQRKETIEAVKSKPFEELTDKQRKFLEYQQKLREKWHKRKDGKKFPGAGGGGGVGGGGGAGSTGAASSSGAATSSALLLGEANEHGEDDDGGFKFASDDDDDDDERFNGGHLNGSPASSDRASRREVGREINGKFVVDA